MDQDRSLEGTNVDKEGELIEKPEAGRDSRNRGKGRRASEASPRAGKTEKENGRPLSSAGGMLNRGRISM